MNILIDELPRSVRIDGTEYPVNYGFRTFILLEICIFDASLSDSERVTQALELFYGDTLRGFILIGDVAKTGIYTSLIREQTPLRELDFASVCREPSLIAFSRRYRDEKLAGRVDENGPVYCDEV